MVNTRPAVFAFFAILGVSAAGLAETGSSRAIAGLVSDELGRPLSGATVSVFGKSLSGGASTVVTDEEGRFEIVGVPPGLYRLRAYLSGFLPSQFARVVIEEGAARAGTILMSLSRLDSGLSSDEYVDDTTASRTVAELRWVIQRQDRNILKETETLTPAPELETWEESPSFAPEFALSGEFGIRAATYDDGLEEFPGAGAGLDARLAYARLFIPGKDGAQWLVSAQLLESALSSWAGRAEYVTSNLSSHRLATGVTYGSFLYGDLGEFRPPESVLGKGLGEQSSSEWFGSVYASDSFLVGTATVQAGLSLQYFDYLNGAAYASPQFAVSYPLGSGERTVLRGALDRRLQAPGGEDIGLLSQVAYSGVYGPTPAHRSLRAESTARFDLGIEHQLSSRTRVALRLFQENANDQLVRAFLEERVPGGAGHFVVTNQGNFRTRGVGVALEHSRGPVQGSVGYTFGRVEPPPTAQALASEPEIHDVTTTLGTSIDSTQTRLQAAYRLIYHPGLTMAETGSAANRGIDGRFSVQVFQLLPFVGWNGTQWELMVALRNLFYDDIENASILDELSVVDAPRRVLGGVTVRF